jgi:hypothetical protein
MAAAREAGIPQKDRYRMTEMVCGEGNRSVKDVPPDKVDALLALFRNYAAYKEEQDSSESEAAEDAPSPEETLVGLGEQLGIKQQVEWALSQHLGDGEWVARQIDRLRERLEQAS